MIEIQNIVSLARLHGWAGVVTLPEHRAQDGADLSWTRGDQYLTVEFVPTTGAIQATTYWDDFEDVPTRKEATHADVVELMESIEDPWGLNEN